MQNISESVNGPDSAFERCFTLQFKKIYKIEENFDIEALVETRTHCVCRGKQKILNALCCARSYCNHWQKRENSLKVYQLCNRIHKFDWFVSVCEFILNKTQIIETRFN